MRSAVPRAFAHPTYDWFHGIGRLVSGQEPLREPRRVPGKTLGGTNMSTIWRCAFGLTALAFGLAWLGPASPAAAQAPWRPDRPVEIIVGTDPGSGNDRSARTLQKIWRSNKLVEVAVTVVNRPGGSGAVGWSLLNT